MLDPVLAPRGAIRSFVQFVLIVITSLALSACGGGGGGGSSTPPGAFTLEADSASFSALRNSAPPPSRSIALTVTGSKVAYVGAAYDNGQTPPAWLRVDINGSGTRYQLVITVQSTALEPGQYTSTFAVGTADAGGNILQRRNVTVTYTVAGSIAMTAAASDTSFIFGDLRSTGTVDIAVQAPDRQWTLTSDAGWLRVPADAQSGTARLAGTIDVGSLAPGSYSATLTARNSASPADTASTVVSIVVNPASLSVEQDSVLLGGADGRSDVLQQVVRFAVATGSAVHPFQATLTMDDGTTAVLATPASGSVGTAGASVTVTASRAGLSGGTRTGELRISVDVKGTVLSEVLPVTFNTEASRIVTTAAGIGLSSVPGRAVLTRRVGVLSSLGRTDIPWTASSNQSWLTVTTSGSTGGDLVLTADPTGLAPDQTYFANVQVASPDNRVENTQEIRVGLYVASAAPVATLVEANAAFLAASPVEPLVAVNDGVGGNVELRHFHTGELVRNLPGVVARAGAMTWSGDGRTLFVHDTTNLRVVGVSPLTGAQLASFDASQGGQAGTALAVLRPAGHPVLITPSSQLFALESGADWSTAEFGIARNAVSLAVSSDQSLVVTDYGAVKRLERSALDGGKWQVEDGVGIGTAQGRAGEACISAAGDRAYTASGYPYEFPATSLSTGAVVQRLPATNYPNSIQCVWNGLVVGGIDGYYAPTDIWVYDGPSGTLLAQLNSSTANGYRSLIDRGLAVSADGTRLVAAARDGGAPASRLHFQSLPPPP